jgi:NAD(P)-dependent dehydrogenase (short-subunit alcohol dehydrogenase family)
VAADGVLPAATNALSGRVAIVTGAARGVGAAIVRDLVACGARVVAADNGASIDGRSEDPAPIAALAAECGDAVAPMALSIAAPGFADAAVALACERFGGLDIVVNNAAILRDAFLFKGSRADFEAVVATDLTAAYELLRAATPVLRENATTNRAGWGRIVTIGSTAALYGNYGQAAYASAKAGLFGLMRVAALDMARSGVTSNMIAPFAASRVTETIVPATQAQAAYKAAALSIPAAPIGRFTSFLCSARAGHITGQVFGVRGRETFVFSQPRPAARATTGPDPSLDDLAALVAAEFAPHFTALETDLDAFSTNPVP